MSSHFYLVKKFETGVSFTKLTYIFEIFSYIIHTIVFTFEGQVKNTLDNINENLRQKFPPSVLFLGLFFCKNLGFFLSERCE
jgi:hypothetical protein